MHQYNLFNILNTKMNHSISSLIADLELGSPDAHLDVVDTNITLVEDNSVLSEALRAIETDTNEDSAGRILRMDYVSDENNFQNIENGNEFANVELEPLSIELNEDLYSEADIEPVKLKLYNIRMS